MQVPQLARGDRARLLSLVFSKPNGEKAGEIKNWGVFRSSSKNFLQPKFANREIAPRVIDGAQFRRNQRKKSGATRDLCCQFPHTGALKLDSSEISWFTFNSHSLEVLF